MNKLLRTLLIICLSASCFTSCRVTSEDMPKIEDVEQLSPYFHYVNIDGKDYIDVELSRCFARNYRHSIDFVGPVEYSKAESIKKCNKVVGYGPVNYTKVFNYHDHVRFLIKKNLQDNSETVAEEDDLEENPL